MPAVARIQSTRRSCDTLPWDHNCIYGFPASCREVLAPKHRAFQTKRLHNQHRVWGPFPQEKCALSEHCLPACKSSIHFQHLLREESCSCRASHARGSKADRADIWLWSITHLFQLRGMPLFKLRVAATWSIALYSQVPTCIWNWKIKSISHIVTLTSCAMVVNV